MQQTVDVFVLGDSADAPSNWTHPDWPILLHIVPTDAPTVAAFARSPWAERLAEGDGEFAALVFANTEHSRRVLNMLVNLLGFESDRAFIVTVDRVADSEWDLSGSVDGYHALLAPRAGHGPVVFRRKKFKEIGSLRPVGEPIWDWIIRAVRAGETVDCWKYDVELKSDACRLPMLVPVRPGEAADWLLEHLEAFDPKEFGLNPKSKVSETALRAGLFQWHDFLDESHQFSQSIEGEGEDQLGDYWHAIMHRREPDYSNAKYWFRQIGPQRIYTELRKEADATLAKLIDPEAARWRGRLQQASKWDPFVFVDLCESCAVDETTELALAARRIQYIEMCLLMRMTCRQCGGGDSAESIALAAKRA